ncbi:type II toxin-antitoxin system prevent-host-death family antitoxin [Endozoicomonas sp. 8E]|uniref:type II toxin-antitoxin system Phd/YefM family antitoxin n=1 Tax=Endozoicomonas sp. 8E TaxID=3035692 RepID=UPI00293952A5|nr:type II toxin-antitoxin system prevent-host-death family antitoxin [Endozoicomonas sp. 8E]WOG28343.1 type II toxin-antitoxin system prevent-host-death family antitoxin [Endozoicomonas sp. 8E]
MKTEVSKSVFKAQALEIMRAVEQSGNEVVITSHGKPTLVIKPYQEDAPKDPKELLKDSVISFENPTDSVSDDWEVLQ